jgi:hypothetical protein
MKKWANITNKILHLGVTEYKTYNNPLIKFASHINFDHFRYVHIVDMTE